MEHTYCVIMAGGKGERFWPLSTNKVPKPFIKLIDDKTMIQATLQRVGRLVPEERTYVVLGKEHLNVARSQLPNLPLEHFIVEPVGRDTAPCIGFAALILLAKDPSAVMVLLPADHYIPDEDAFRRTISLAVKSARRDESLVTIGIRPTRPETGYGYIHANKKSAGDGSGCYLVNKFVEKPDVATATQYLAEGSYYWNSGIFVWQVKAILKAIEQHMPALYKGLLKLGDALGRNDAAAVGATFRSFKAISIDYGVMEKARGVMMVEAQFTWDDVGTWSSLLRVLNVDENGNYRQGNPVCIDTENCVVYGDNIAVGTIGVSNLIVIASKKGVLVCDVNRDQEARKIVKAFEAETEKPE